jgi:hypothetical protein
MVASLPGRFAAPLPSSGIIAARRDKPEKTLFHSYESSPEKMCGAAAKKPRRPIPARRRNRANRKPDNAKKTLRMRRETVY